MPFHRILLPGRLVNVRHRVSMRTDVRSNEKPLCARCTGRGDLDRPYPKHLPMPSETATVASAFPVNANKALPTAGAIGGVPPRRNRPCCRYSARCVVRRSAFPECTVTGSRGRCSVRRAHHQQPWLVRAALRRVFGTPRAMRRSPRSRTRPRLIRARANRDPVSPHSNLLWERL